MLSTETIADLRKALELRDFRSIVEGLTQMHGYIKGVACS